MSSSKPFALVTGASSGIGREMAKLLAREGHDLILVARGRPALEALASEIGPGVAIRVEPADLGQPGAGRALAETLLGQGLKVALLVNNAGLGTIGPVAQNDPDTLSTLVAVNVAAVTDLTRAFLPGMLERHSGGILNVASTAAFQPGPLMAVYYASKAYVLSFTEALWEECRGTGVKVSCLCPGPTTTGFQDRADMHHVRLVSGGLVPMADALSVAKAGLAGLKANRRVVIPGPVNALLAMSAPLTPRPLSLRIARYLQSSV